MTNGKMATTINLKMEVEVLLWVTEMMIQPNTL